MNVNHERRYEEAVERNLLAVESLLPEKYFGLGIAKLKTKLGIRTKDQSHGERLSKLKDALAEKQKRSQ